MGDWPNKKAISVETGTITADPISSGTFIQVVAASAAPVKLFNINGSFYGITADATTTLELATGAGGAEVVCATHFTRATSLINMYSFSLTAGLNKPTATRLAFKATKSAGSPALYAGYTAEEE